MTQRREDPLLASRQMQRRFGSIHAAAIAGIVCAAGWSVSLAGLLQAPGIGASDADIDRYYSDPTTSTAALVWIQVLVFATIAFRWFVGVVRGRLGDREPKLFGTVFLGASILLAGLLFVGRSWRPLRCSSPLVGGRRDQTRWRSREPRRRWCCRCSRLASQPW